MAELDSPAWLLIALIAAGAGIATLYLLATYAREQTGIHDLRHRVIALREQYREQLKAAGQEIIEAEVVEDAPAADPSPATPAPARRPA